MADTVKRHREDLAAAKMEQQQWVPMWRQLNEAFYPFLYSNLMSTSAIALQGGRIRNPKMLDGAPALSLLILSSGFMNGVTSPARKWVNVKRPGSEPYEKPSVESATVYSAIRDKILEVLAGTNYYDSRAVQVYDGAGIGTGVLLIYEDFEKVVRFQVLPPGSYMLETDEDNNVIRLFREFRMKARDMVKEFGEDAVPASVRERANAGGAQARTEYVVQHVIEPSAQDGLMPTNAPFRELFWMASPQAGGNDYLAKRPMYEWPVATFRWSCPDNCTYGIPPTLGCLGKAVQLQNLEYKSDQGLDKMVSPPLLADHSLKNRPKAFSANGITYTSNLSANSGARPIYQMNIPFQELEIKRARIVEGINDILFNHLFNMISQLETVRSATEIDARREEKLVQLGPVLHRSYLEDIGVVIKRVYGILRRKQLVEPLPAGQGAEIEFSNILSDVQKASDVATLERFTAFVGQVIPAWPEAQPKVNISDIITQYAEGLGVRPTVLNSDEAAADANAQAQEMQQLAEMAKVAKDFGAAGQSLGNVDVGGGMSAVQSML